MMKREGNYEFLRIVSTIAVIFIHVSGNYVTAMSSSHWLGEIYRDNAFVHFMWNTVSRFAVPCFVMISGAFHLDNEKNGDFKYFYRKIFKNIVVPTIVVSLLYVIYSIFYSLYSGKTLSVSVWEPVKAFLMGKPFYHLWYLYMMIFVFVLTPVVIRLKREIGEQKFRKTALLFFPFAMFSVWSASPGLNWDIGFSFCYLGYYMLGYVLRKGFDEKKNNYKAVLLIVFGFAVLVLQSYFRYLNWKAGKPELRYPLSSPYCPVIVCASVCIFIGFSMLRVRNVFQRLSGITFEIYLLHAGVWHIASRAFITAGMDSRIVIPIAVFCVFAVTIVFSIIYQAIWNKLGNRFSG